MPRPPAAGATEKTKQFTVAAGRSMWDNDNIRKNAGDTIDLTSKQAKYFLKMGAVEMIFEEFDDEGTSDDGADTPEESAGPKTYRRGKSGVGSDSAPSPRSNRKTIAGGD